MKKLPLEIGPGAAFLWAFLLLVLRNEELAALLLPVMVHELGHLAAILALGLWVEGIRASLGGFTINYGGDTSPAGQALIAAAGPAAGLGFAWLASRLGLEFGVEWLCLSAGMSLLLSLFNLLPVPPLDGGQLCAALACAALGESRGKRVCACLALAASACTAALGASQLLRGRGMALLLLGLWLFGGTLWSQGLVKTGKIR